MREFGHEVQAPVAPRLVRAVMAPLAWAGERRCPALAGQHPGLLRLSLTAALIGSLLLVPAVLGAMRLIGGSAAWLSLTGGSLMTAGYVCYLGVAAMSAPVLAMAGGRPGWGCSPR